MLLTKPGIKTAYARRLPAPGSRLPAPGSRLPAPGSRLPAPGSYYTHCFEKNLLNSALNSPFSPQNFSLTGKNNSLVTTSVSPVTIETYLLGRHELGVKIIYVTGNPADPANKGFRIWYTVAAPGETPPVNPDEQRKSFYTKRKKDMIEFEFKDSGKTAYFAVQIENKGRKGPWGPLVSALIP
jgi:hypothetical protein